MTHKYNGLMMLLCANIKTSDEYGPRAGVFHHLRGQGGENFSENIKNYRTPFYRGGRDTVQEKESLPLKNY